MRRAYYEYLARRELAGARRRSGTFLACDLLDVARERYAAGSARSRTSCAPGRGAPSRRSPGGRERPSRQPAGRSSTGCWPSAGRRDRDGPAPRSCGRKSRIFAALLEAIDNRSPELAALELRNRGGSIADSPDEEASSCRTSSPAADRCTAEASTPCGRSVSAVTLPDPRRFAAASRCSRRPRRTCGRNRADRRRRRSSSSSRHASASRISMRLFASRACTATAILPTDQLSLESAIATYRTGKVPFVTVLEALNTLYADRAFYSTRLADAEKWRVAIDEGDLQPTGGMVGARRRGRRIRGVDDTRRRGGDGALRGHEVTAMKILSQLRSSVGPGRRSSRRRSSSSSSRATSGQRLPAGWRRARATLRRHARPAQPPAGASSTGSIRWCPATSRTSPASRRSWTWTSCRCTTTARAAGRRRQERRRLRRRSPFRRSASRRSASSSARPRSGSWRRRSGPSAA